MAILKNMFWGNFKCIGCSLRDAKNQIKKKHCTLTGSLIHDLVRIHFLTQWDNLSDQFSKRQLFKSPEGLLLVNFKSITNPGSVSGQETPTLLTLSGRRQSKSIRSGKHQELQWGLLCSQSCFPTLYIILIYLLPLLFSVDEPRPYFLTIKFPKLEWKRQAKLSSSSGHIPSSSCPLPSPSNKLDALNKMKAAKFSVDVSVPPTKSTYTHSKQRTRPEV